MTGFIIGLMVGGLIGFFTMALLSAASAEDDRMEKMQSAFTKAPSEKRSEMPAS